MKRPPAYAIRSVDNALRLAVILQMEGAISVADAADRLGVAGSTAHRLLQTLVYRDYAFRRRIAPIEPARFWSFPRSPRSTLPAFARLRSGRCGRWSKRSTRP